MNEIEQLIFRYLDQEMTPVELEEFHQLLQESPQARETLQQMELIRSVAREMPHMTSPSADVESALFQQIFNEEIADEAEEEKRRRAVAAVPSEISRGNVSAMLAALASGVRARAILVPALMLLLVLGGGLLVNSGLFQNGGTTNQLIVNNVGAAEDGQGLSNQSSSDQIASVDVQADAENEEVARASSRGITTSTLRSASAIDLKSTASLSHGDVTTSHSPAIDRSEDTKNIAIGPEKLLKDSGLAPAPNPLPTTNESAKEKKSNPTQNLASTDLPTFELEEPIKRESHSSPLLTASYRHGVAALNTQAGLETAQEMNLRLDGHLGDRHRVSVSVGSSPLLVADRTTTIRTSIAPNDPNKQGNGPSVTRFDVAESERIDDEVWAGIGYGFALYQKDGIAIEPGVNVGVGGSSLRYGVELSARYHVTDRIAVNAVPYISRITPHDQTLQSIEVDNPNQIVEQQTPALTSFGAQIGLSIDIGK